MKHLRDARNRPSTGDASTGFLQRRDFRRVSAAPRAPESALRGAGPGLATTALQARLRRSWVALALASALLASLPAAVGPALAAKPEANESDPHPLDDHLDATYRADLDGIIERRFLRVLTSHGAFDYFLEDGTPRGFQYEMVKAFVARLNERHPAPRGKPRIAFEIIPVSDGELIPMLVAGRGDLIAARLTRTPERETSVAFSRPYRTVDEVVVQRRGGPAIERLADLSGLSIAVRRSSSYYDSLVAENAKLRTAGRVPIRIEVVDDDLPTERILLLVASGALERTVADALVADAVAALRPELQVLSSVRVREEGQLAWAVPIGAMALLAEVDAFLPRYREGSLHGNLAVQSYFGTVQPLERALAPGEDTPLSPFDDALRRFAERYAFDWRLMAAVAWQESRFDQLATNRSGATGLFQIKPTTAREPYVAIPDVTGAENARNNIHAGIKYLAWIKGRYFDGEDEMSEKDRLRMTLAAYNAGPKTLMRARKKAIEMGLDPNRWFRNVELAMLAMRKREPVRYVSQINQSYVAYLLLGYE